MNLKKLENVEYYDKSTGELLEREIIKSISREDEKNRVRRLFSILKDNPNELTLEELEELRSIKRLKKRIKIDFSKDSFFTIKNSFEFIKNLSIHTRGVIYSIGHMITHDGRLKYGNNKLISNFEDLRLYLNVSKKIWSTFVKPDVDEYCILTKEKINNKWCILMNPLFAVKDRTVTETMFIAFHKELKEFLHPLDFLYLKKLHNIEI